MSVAREPRIEYPGALFPVVKGNNRQEIFVGDDDRSAYLERLELLVAESTVLEQVG
jgi:hypothetical protein